jgi:hypothetical protein
MKNLIILIGLITLLCIMTSCEREYCWECELTTGYRHLPIEPNWTYTTTQNEYCNKTQKEIDQIVLVHEYDLQKKIIAGIKL